MAQGEHGDAFETLEIRSTLWFVGNSGSKWFSGLMWWDFLLYWALRFL